jgi:hypothetical protein
MRPDGGREIAAVHSVDCVAAQGAGFPGVLRSLRTGSVMELLIWSRLT